MHPLLFYKPDLVSPYFTRMSQNFCFKFCTYWQTILIFTKCSLQFITVHTLCSQTVCTNNKLQHDLKTTLRTKLLYSIWSRQPVTFHRTFYSFNYLSHQILLPSAYKNFIYSVLQSDIFFILIIINYNFGVESNITELVWKFLKMNWQKLLYYHLKKVFISCTLMSKTTLAGVKHCL